jgi:streptomycin 6-kinase
MAAIRSRAEWQATLPDVVATLCELWFLQVLEPFEPGGQCAWVAPARRASGEHVALKIGWPHPEARDEAAGLALWNGDGTVRLLESAIIGETPALLLELCAPGTSLAALLPPDERDVVVAGLLRRVWREPPPGHGFRALQQMSNDWADEAERCLADTVVADEGLIRTGLSMFRSLPASADRDVVLFTDLHAENVLAAQREPWLAIDPKPYVGDPTYDVLQHMLNVPRLHVDPDGLVDRIADLAGVDAARLRLWTFARCAVMAVDDPAFVQVAQRLAP